MYSIIIEIFTSSRQTNTQSSSWQICEICISICWFLDFKTAFVKFGIYLCIGCFKMPQEGEYFASKCHKKVSILLQNAIERGHSYSSAHNIPQTCHIHLESGKKSLQHNLANIPTKLVAERFKSRTTRILLTGWGTHWIVIGSAGLIECKYLSIYSYFTCAILSSTLQKLIS